MYSKVSDVVRFIVALVMSFCFRTTEVGRGKLVVVSLSHTSVQEASSTISIKLPLTGGSVVSHRRQIKIMIKIKSAGCFGFIFVSFFHWVLLTTS